MNEDFSTMLINGSHNVMISIGGLHCGVQSIGGFIYSPNNIARLDRHWINQPAVWDHTADINPRMPTEVENATDRIPLEV
jgi:hypothetical protein